MTSRHLLLLRHGETESSRSGAFTGRADHPLTDSGRVQASAWAEVLPPIVDRARTSPLRRASETATLAGFRDAVIAPSLLEWDLGVLEGRPADGFRAANPGWSVFTDGPPEGSGESVDQVESRAAEVLSTLADRDGVTLLVSHGQFLRALAFTTLGIPVAHAKALSLGPCRMGILTQRPSGWSLTGWNLPAEMAAATILERLT